MYEGEVLSHTDSSLAFSSNEIAGGLPIFWKSIHQLSISGRPVFLIAGAMGGGFAGYLVGSWLESSVQKEGMSLDRLARVVIRFR